MAIGSVSLSRTRPKFNATVNAPPDSRRVNFAGPQMSTKLPGVRANRAAPECTVTTLPLDTKSVVAPWIEAGYAPPSTEISWPSSLPTDPEGQCSCARVPKEKASRSKSAAVKRAITLQPIARHRHRKTASRMGSIPVDIEDSLVVTYTIAQ